MIARVRSGAAIGKNKQRKKGTRWTEEKKEMGIDKRLHNASQSPATERRRNKDFYRETADKWHALCDVLACLI